MNAINEGTTVRELVVGHPETRPVLERLGIDYCCGGAARLADAAEAAGKPLREVAEAVEAAIRNAADAHPERNWADAPAGELARHILETHHVFMKRELPRLRGLLDKVIAAHSERHGDALRQLLQTFNGLREEIEAHLYKEEEILFPYILALGAWRPGSGPAPASHCGTVANPIRQMEFEHDNAGQALAKFREITADYALPDDACASFAALYDGLQALERDLHEHIHLENNILFPKSLELERKAHQA